MTITCCSNLFCCTTSCPEPVDVVQNISEVTTQAGFVVPLLTFVPASTSSGRLHVQAQVDGADVTGRYKVVVWFEDTANFTELVSMDPPAIPGAGMVEYITDAAGKVIDGDTIEGILLQDSTETPKTWYAYARIGGNVCSAPASVTFGS